LKTILIVEDLDINIDLLVQLLEDDYSLLIAKDGQQGLDLTQQKKPDLVLMDMSLPVMDGYEATLLIRRQFPALPIIGLSAYAMQSEAEKALVAGCSDYLTKPVDEDLLFSLLEKYLG
jgi:two-component system cell cycle response regulator DivK